MNASELKAFGSSSTPLIHPEKKIMLIFSPKSACSSAVIWFFHHMGLAQEAEQYDHWPHKYRIDRFYSRPEVKAAARAIPLRDFRIVRVIRDPVDRAVSSYRHALGTGYARETIRTALGIDTVTDGLSFSQFIDFLETEDLTRCNPHHRVQENPLESLVDPHRTINISKEDLFEGLRDFEIQCGLPPTDFERLTWLHEVQKRRSPVWVKTTEEGEAKVFSMEEARNGPWPRLAMSDRARERLEKLYQSDIVKYSKYL